MNSAVNPNGLGLNSSYMKPNTDFVL